MGFDVILSQPTDQNKKSFPSFQYHNRKAMFYCVSMK